MIVALFNRKSDGGKTNVTFDPVGGWTRQRLRVVVIDADRKGENENCWLDWSQQRAKEGLTRRFEVIGLTPGAPRREALEIACTVDHVVTDGPPRFAVRTRSVLLATDVALTPFQPSPSGERALVEIRKLLEKAQIFRPDLHPDFILNRYGPRVTTACDRKSVFAVRPERSRGQESQPGGSRRRERRESETVHRANDDRRHAGTARPHQGHSVPARADGRRDAARSARTNSRKRKEMGRMDDLTEVELYWQEGTRRALDPFRSLYPGTHH